MDIDNIAEKGNTAKTENVTRAHSANNADNILREEEETANAGQGGAR